MKPLRESLRLAQPLRDLTLVRCGPRATLHQQDLAASYERGRREGERALSEQLLRQRSAVVDLQNGILTSLRNVLPQVIRDTENALVELAFAVAQRIAAGAPIDAATVQAAVQEAVAEAADTTELSIQLHPADLALLQALPSPLLKPSDPKSIQWVPTHQISRGGCIVQTRFGVIDARRETRVELLRRSLQIAPRSVAPPPVPSVPAAAARAASPAAIVASANGEPARQTEPQAEQPILQP